MALSGREIFLSFTTVALAAFSIGLGKCYLAENNEKLRQINLNAQLNTEKDSLKGQIWYLQLRAGEWQNVLSQANEIYAKIQDQVQFLERQLKRNIEQEVLDEKGEKDSESAKKRAQEIEKEICEEKAEISNRIKKLYNDFLILPLIQLKLGAKVTVYSHLVDVMHKYMELLINENGDLDSEKKGVAKILMDYINMSEKNCEKSLSEVFDKVDTAIKNYELEASKYTQVVD